MRCPCPRRAALLMLCTLQPRHASLLLRCHAVCAAPAALPMLCVLCPMQGGIYTLPSHLSPGARDLIPRMLLVDPLKRITIPEIRCAAPLFLGVRVGNCHLACCTRHGGSFILLTARFSASSASLMRKEASLSRAASAVHLEIVYFLCVLYSKNL